MAAVFPDEEAVNEALRLVMRKEGRLAQVSCIDNRLQQPLGTHAETAVRRHAIVERLQVGLEPLFGEAPLTQVRQQLLVAVHALLAGHDLGAAAVQVKAVRARRIGSTGLSGGPFYEIMHPS